MIPEKTSSESAPKSPDPKAPESQPPPPPPRSDKHKISLKDALAHDEAQPNQSDSSGPHGAHASMTGKQQEMEANLLELQAELAVKEKQLEEKEQRLRILERELNEKDALLEARLKLAESNNTQEAE